MDDSTRRRLLKGVSAAGLVLAAAGGSAAFGTGRDGGGEGSRQADGPDGGDGSGGENGGGEGGADDGRDEEGADGDPPLTVSIAGQDDPVPAGAYLRMTTELTNRGSSDVRTGMVLLVGEDETRIERRELTVPAGETETVRQGFHTYPVPTDDAFPVRVETDWGSAETTVAVEGAAPLSTSRPGPALSVEPGTEVFFEAGAVEPGASQRTIWWLDGDLERVGGLGPWEATYYAEADANYWWHAFDDPGTYEVAAAVVPDDGDRSYAATWTVEVTAGGNASPTIDDRSPADERLEIERGESYEVEFRATDPDGDLDRVVWWLTQADVILGIDPLDGATDTARLRTDAFCHTCRVIAWVICADGTATVLDPGWELREAGLGADFGVSIRSTNSPLPAGEVLEVVVDVENGGGTPGTESVELVVGHDPTLVDCREVSLGPGETETVMLAFETYPVRRDQRFPVRVVCGDDEDVTDVRVYT